MLSACAARFFRNLMALIYGFMFRNAMRHHRLHQYDDPGLWSGARSYGAKLLPITKLEATSVAPYISCPVEVS